MSNVPNDSPRYGRWLLVASIVAGGITGAVLWYRQRATFEELPRWAQESERPGPTVTWTPAETPGGASASEFRFPETIPEWLGTLAPEDPDSWPAALEAIESRESADGEERRHVALVLAAMVARSDEEQRLRALSLLQQWAVPEVIPVLAARADSARTLPERLAALEALATLETPDVAPHIAACLPRDRDHVALILRRLGPDAEPALYPYLNHPRDRVRELACRVLASIGTAESLSYLQDLAGDESFPVRTAAQHALREIRRRHGPSTG